MLVQFRSCSSLVWNDSSVFSGLDGSTSASERERLINQFNDPQNNTTWVFLLSTRCTSLLSPLHLPPRRQTHHHISTLLCCASAGPAAWGWTWSALTAWWSLMPPGTPVTTPKQCAGSTATVRGSSATSTAWCAITLWRRRSTTDKSPSRACRVRQSHCPVALKPTKLMVWRTARV